VALIIDAEGTLVADGTEQIISTVVNMGKVSGYISLENMQDGDTVIIREYINLGGGYKLYATATYTGVQSEPVVYLTVKEVLKGVRVTLEQSAGELRELEYVIGRDDTQGVKGFKI
jgi:hypothetical protein